MEKNNLTLEDCFTEEELKTLSLEELRERIDARTDIELENKWALAYDAINRKTGDLIGFL